MKVLVTGSRGFVGSRLANALKKKGHTVKEFDLATGNDILDKGQCLQACKGIEAVYHLAAVLEEDSPMLKKVNVEGTENMVEAAAKARCSQFIFLSTVGVHAECKETVNEKSKFKPATKYEKSKAKAESIVWNAQEMLPITVIRSAIVFGPNKYWKRIIELIEKGFPLIGKGKQEWQTIYIDDLVSSLVFVLGREQAIGEVFIAAEQERPSLLKLYSEIRKQLGLKGKVKTVPVWQAKAIALFYRIRRKKSLISKPYIERLARQRSYDTKKINGIGWSAKAGMKEAVQKTLKALGK